MKENSISGGEEVGNRQGGKRGGILGRRMRFFTEIYEEFFAGD